MQQLADISQFEALQTQANERLSSLGTFNATFKYLLPPRLEDRSEIDQLEANIQRIDDGWEDRKAYLVDSVQQEKSKIKEAKQHISDTEKTIQADKQYFRGQYQQHKQRLRQMDVETISDHEDFD